MLLLSLMFILLMAVKFSLKLVPVQQSIIMQNPMAHGEKQAKSISHRPLLEQQMAN